MSDTSPATNSLCVRSPMSCEAVSPGASSVMHRYGSGRARSRKQDELTLRCFLGAPQQAEPGRARKRAVAEDRGKAWHEVKRTSSLQDRPGPLCGLEMPPPNEAPAPIRRRRYAPHAFLSGDDIGSGDRHFSGRLHRPEGSKAFEHDTDLFLGREFRSAPPADLSHRGFSGLLLLDRLIDTLLGVTDPGMCLLA